MYTAAGWHRSGILVTTHCLSAFSPSLWPGPLSAAPIFYRSCATLPARRTAGDGCISCAALQKLLLADTAAVFIDTVYAAPGAASGPAAILATVLFAGQIYWDFSGYSDIAAGAAALLGVRLSRNFDHPYQAVCCAISGTGGISA